MIATAREAQVSAAFVALADTLAADFDVTDLLHRLVDEAARACDARAGSVVLVATDGRLQFAASTSEQARAVELQQLAAASGPVVESIRSAQQVAVADIADVADVWPEFNACATSHGFGAAYSVPLRLRDEVVGAMTLFHARSGPTAVDDLAVAQALADVATIGILQERAARSAAALAQQLQKALDSRVVIEQAKGVLAGSAGIDMNSAFSALHTRARTNNLTLRRVAEDVIAAATTSHVVEDSASPRPPKGGLLQ